MFLLKNVGIVWHIQNINSWNKTADTKALSIVSQSGLFFHTQHIRMEHSVDRMSKLSFSIIFHAIFRTVCIKLAPFSCVDTFALSYCHHQTGELRVEKISFH